MNMDAYTENKNPDTRKGIRKGSAVICLIPADIIRKTVIPNGITVFWYAERDSSAFWPVWAKIKVRLRQAVAGGAHPRRIQMVLVPFGQNKNPDTRKGIWVSGTPKGTRTPDLLIRSQSLYPTELSARVAHSLAPKYNSTAFGKMQVLF